MAKRDYFEEGCKYQQGEAYEKALRNFNVVLRHNPQHANAHFLSGVIWMHKGGWALAKRHLEQAIEAGTDDFKLLNAARNNLAVCYRRLDRTSTALKLFNDAASRHVDSNLLSNCGSCNLDIGRWEDAERALRRAAILQPDHNDANWNLALSLLTQRKWREAWRQHEWGFRANERGGRPYADHWPQWKGEPLAGKTILVWGEQGIGDEILFAGCLENLKALGPKEVIFDCHPRLLKLYRRSFPWLRAYGRRKDHTVGAMIYVRAAAMIAGLGKDETERMAVTAMQVKAPFDAVLPRPGAKKPDDWVRIGELPYPERKKVRDKVREIEVFFRWKPDYQIPMGTLPMYFRNNDEDFLNVKADFLAPDSNRVNHYRDKYPSDNLRVGLCWLGGSRKTAIHRRSVPLEKLVSLLKMPMTWLSLQYGDVGYEVAQVNARHNTNLIHDEAAIEDLDELAALTASCDLVISVIQTQVHMAGALGVETWCLTCHAAPWKFHDPLVGREDIMLWHPRVKMIRQGKGDQWPLEHIQSLLASRLKATLPTEKTLLPVFGNSSRQVSTCTAT